MIIVILFCGKRDLFKLAIVCPLFLRGFVFLNMLLINLLFLWERGGRTVKKCLSSSNGEHMKGFMRPTPIFERVRMDDIQALDGKRELKCLKQDL